MFERLRARGAAIALGAALLVAGCEETEEPEFPTITGSWQGTSGEITMTLSVIEGEDGDVAGSGTLSSDNASFPFQAQGGHLFPDVVLDLVIASEGEALDFEAVVAFDAEGGIPAMDGSLSGGGFDRFPITLTRR